MGEIVFAAVAAAVACGMALGLGLSWAAGRRYDTWRKGHIKNFDALSKQCDEYRELLLAKMRPAADAEPEAKLPLPEMPVLVNILEMKPALVERDEIGGPQESTMILYRRADESNGLGETHLFISRAQHLELIDKLDQRLAWAVVARGGPAAQKGMDQAAAAPKECLRGPPCPACASADTRVMICAHPDKVVCLKCGALWAKAEPEDKPAAAQEGGVWNVSTDPEINSVLRGLPLQQAAAEEKPDGEEPIDRSVYKGPCVSCGVPAPMKTGGDHVVCPACSELTSVIKACAAADAVLCSADYKRNCKPFGDECGRCGGRKQEWGIVCAGCWAELVKHELDKLDGEVRSEPLDRSVYKGPCVACCEELSNTPYSHHVVCDDCARHARTQAALAEVGKKLTQVKDAAAQPCPMCRGVKRSGDIVCMGCYADMVKNELARLGKPAAGV